MPKSQQGPTEPPVTGLESLTELALDVRWSWNHGSDELWARLDPELWAATHNPWVVLQTVSRAKLRRVLASSTHHKRADTVMGQRRKYLESKAWFQNRHPKDGLAAVAYFSLEFGLSEALPIYAGGLGNVAGDLLKSSSDLGVPVVGVGLLYQQGYFRQAITAEGRQEVLYPYNDPGQLPVSPVRNSSGEWLRVPIQLAGHRVWLRAWQVQVGRLKLYLLDSNDPANPPTFRAVTSELYGGGPELRLRQELALGIGGWRLLRALRVRPEVCHLNEGHAAFAVLERARSFMEDSGRPFEEALMVTRAGNLFTTHTSVAAGFDRFAPVLMDQYLRRMAEGELGIALADLLALGRGDPTDSSEPFSMAYLALRGSGAVNGVSRLHGAVSRRLFAGLFPRWPVAEVPVGHVTNGVHVPTWDSPEADALWTHSCGCDRWRGALETVERDIRCASDADLWAVRQAGRRALVEYARERLAWQIAASGTADESTARECLDPEVLTLGFARRFATYKRPNLLLHDPERLLRLLFDADRPVQLVIAGKAHPADQAGQEMIAEWLRFIDRPGVHRRVVFIPDYDLLTAERLVQGVDLWLNTPRRPWEASGTSGMKVLVNGGLNLSELDGWWAEAYAPDVGWALGDGAEHGDSAEWDTAEAESLYALVEREIAPAFYRRDAQGVPADWLAKVRESMARLTPRFSANRMVRDYTERYYLPLAAEYRKRTRAQAGLGGKLVAWRRELAEHWSDVRFGSVELETRDGEHRFTAEVHLGGLAPEAVRVELFADSDDGGAASCVVMVRERRPRDAAGGNLYSGSVPASRPAGDYTPRIVPYHPDASVPLEASHILWQR